MKVETIIKRLQEGYNPNDELVIAWWSKDLANSLIGADDVPEDFDDEIPQVTDEEWELVCYELQDLTNRANEDVCDAICWSINNQRKETKENSND